jgi:xylulokinase
MKRLFIGLDSGTQSTRAILIDGDTGRVLAARSAAQDILPSEVPGTREQDPADWIRAASDVIAGVLRDAGPDAARQVAAIGISGQQHGFVPLDADGRVIRPAKLWCDTSTAPQCETLIARLGGLPRTIEQLGNGIPPGFTASKILWLKEHEPENYARLATVLLPHDYLAFWLTGRAHMEWGDASGTALMDVRTRTWRTEALEAIDPGLATKLPTPAHPREAAGVVQPDVARQFGLRGDVVVSGSGDNMMGAVGTGNVADGMVTASLGTSGTIYACSKQPIVDPAGEVAAFCDATGQWLPLVCTMNVTVATEMVRKLFGFDHAALSGAAGSVDAGADGLLLIPFFEGERTPNVPDGTGVWIGVRPRTLTPAHLARAAMEGATLGLNYGLNRMRALGLQPKEIRLTGGGARSAVWRQIAADVFDCPVVCPANEEGAAYGAALHAMWVWGHANGAGRSIEEIAGGFIALNEASRAQPDSGRVGRYKNLQAIFDRAVRGLAGTFTDHRRYLRGQTPGEGPGQA